MGCELESRELMSLCLQNVAGLNKAQGGKNGEKVRLIDAGWIWTEPHSMRLKIRLTVQKEVQLGTILQQSFVVVFVIRNQQCTECQAEFRQGVWRSLVQVRQRVGHKRTFLYLEQLILKHGAHRGSLNIETFRDGMDFYFPDKGKAARFITFLENVVPIKVKTSKKLIGTDDKSNISNFKHTNLVEICTLCKDDLLYLPPRTARNLGNITRLVLVKNVTNVIHLIDPLTGQTAQMNGEAFWRDPIRPVITAARSRFVRCVVLGKDPIPVPVANVSKRTATRRNRNKLALLTVAKEVDLGVNDVTVEESSHVGYLMNAGDVAVGYDLRDVQFVDDEAEVARANGKLPDVVVLRKLYGGVATGEALEKSRLFKLDRLNVKIVEACRAKKAKKDQMDDTIDEEDFLREVEADKEMRININLYKSEVAIKEEEEGGDAAMDNGNGEDDEDDDDDQQVKLDELLDGLILDENPDEKEQQMADVNIDEDEIWGGVGQKFVEEGKKAAEDGVAFTGRDEAGAVKDKEAAVVVGTVFGTEFMKKPFKFT